MSIGRATAFVGAGFSLNAEHPSHVCMKTWNELKEMFRCKLYGETNYGHDEDVVRLASLVAAQFGHNELDMMLEEALPDSKVSPGEIHKKLIELPWRDILTTNYDTLLERASLESTAKFKLVTNKETLLYQPSPRIIKLHGSFPNIRPYVMTYEDYRQYPFLHPEMVNTVRQSLLESLVCLIGFSGNDPNFRSWIGWLRDVMGPNRTCPTYLITFNDMFPEAEKKLLGDMGIDIINIAEVKGIGNYKEAYQFFLESIHQQEKEWRGHIHHDPIQKGKEKETMEDATNKMAFIRKSYPGWMVLPVNYYKDFKDVDEDGFFYGNLLERLEENWSLKLRFLFELNWRLEVSHTPKQFDWYVSQIKDVIRHIDNPSQVEQKIIAELEMSVLTIYRLNHQVGEFKSISEELLKKSHLIPVGRIYYEQILHAYSCLDYKEIIRIFSVWEKVPGDYPDAIRKASVMLMLGKKVEAENVLDDCQVQIRRALLTEKNDAFLQSCLMASMQLQSGHKELKKAIGWQNGELVSFSDLTTAIKAKSADKQNEGGLSVSHKFDIGNYTRTWTLGLSGFVKDYLYPYRWFSIRESFGMDFFVYDENYFENCLSRLFEYSWEYAFGHLLSTGSSKMVEKLLDRRCLAQIEQCEAEYYFDSLILYVENIKLLTNARQKQKVDSTVIIVLGHLCVKIGQEKVVRFAKSLFNFPESIVSKVFPIVYDSLTDDNLSQLVGEIIEKRTLATEYKIGIPLPDANRKLAFPVTLATIERIKKEFQSQEKAEQCQAYMRCCVLLRNDKVSTEDRNVLSEEIIRWRNDKNFAQYTIYSYNLIPTTNEEKEKLTSFIEERIDKYCEQRLVTGGSSEPISQWTSDMEFFFSISHWLDEKQVARILTHTEKLIAANLKTLEQDDEETFFGGIRNFVSELFEAIRRFVFSTNTGQYQISDDLRRILFNLEDKGCHVLPILIGLNVGGLLTKVKSLLLSESRSERVEGVQSLLMAHHKGKSISKELDSIFTLLKILNGRHTIDALILFEQLLLLGYNENNFRDNVAELIKHIHTEFENFNLTREELVDLQYYTNRVHGIIAFIDSNKINQATPLNTFGFNDVSIGFDIGRYNAQDKGLS